MNKKKPQIVLVIGVSPRCGTNFLASLLELHPALRIPDFAKEDHIFEHTSLLVEFSERTTFRWSCWNKGKYNLLSERDLLLVSIGKGMVEHFKRDGHKDQIPLLKTPLTPFTRFNHGLPDIKHALQLFPDAKIVFLHRDGRDIVYSASKTWKKKPFLLFFSRWFVGCRMIANFEDEFKALEGSKWISLRYEDLLIQAREKMNTLLDFLGLPEEFYPWDDMERMPILGSSEASKVSGKVSWEPVAKTADFNPVGRGKKLGFLRKFFFKTLGRQHLERNGYVLD
jgi:hypothetical protein